MAPKRDERETPCFVLRILSEQAMVRIGIEGNGPGTAEQTREPVLEPFFVSMGVDMGTGCGMAVACHVMNNGQGDSRLVVVRLLPEGRNP